MIKSLKASLAISALALAVLPSTASATVTLVSVTPGTVPYAGPTPTYDFESPAPVSGGIVTSTSVANVSAQPYGSTGNFWTTGPTDGGPGIMDLSAIGDIFNISFIWGSVDSYNTLEFLDAALNPLATFVGNDIYNPANGGQSDPNTNPVVRFDLTGSDVGALTYLRLTSTTNAFETDNFAINAVPEPATWMMMLLGFGAAGYSLRRQRKSSLAQLV